MNDVLLPTEYVKVIETRYSIHDVWSWAKYQIITLNMINAALLVAVLTISTSTQTQVNDLNTQNTIAMQNLGLYKLASVDLSSKINEAKNLQQTLSRCNESVNAISLELNDILNARDISNHVDIIEHDDQTSGNNYKLSKPSRCKLMTKNLRCENGFTVIKNGVYELIFSTQDVDSPNSNLSFQFATSFNIDGNNDVNCISRTFAYGDATTTSFIGHMCHRVVNLYGNQTINIAFDGTGNVADVKFHAGVFMAKLLREL